MALSSKAKMKLLVLVSAGVMAVSTLACGGVIGDNGCPTGSYPVMVNGNKVCRVGGAVADPTPVGGWNQVKPGIDVLK